MLAYFGMRYFRAAHFVSISGITSEQQATAILANRRFMVNMGSMMGMGGM